MKEETKIDLAAAYANGALYDEYVARLFLNKEIVAPILRMVVPEFADCTVEEVIRCIDSDIVNTEPVDDISVRMDGLPTELKSTTDKLVRFDTHFRAVNPRKSSEDLVVHLYIDLEVQNQYVPSNPRYPLIKRAEYYVARELCRQLGTITHKTNYAKLEKVYSIWICNDDIPKNMQNSVSVYHMQRDTMIGFCDEPVEDYDLMTVIMIRRGKSATSDGVFDYLEGVFTSNIGCMQKYSDIEWGDDLVKEVDSMTGLGDSILRKGIQQGFQQGNEKGKREGMYDAILRFSANGGTPEMIKQYLGVTDEDINAALTISNKPD